VEQTAFVTNDAAARIQPVALTRDYEADGWCVRRHREDPRGGDLLQRLEPDVKRNADYLGVRIVSVAASITEVNDDAELTLTHAARSTGEAKGEFVGDAP
jgi:hypothetical protein